MCNSKDLLFIPDLKRVSIGDYVDLQVADNTVQLYKDGQMVANVEANPEFLSLLTEENDRAVALRKEKDGIVFQHIPYTFQLPNMEGFNVGEFYDVGLSPNGDRILVFIDDKTTFSTYVGANRNAFQLRTRLKAVVKGNEDNLFFQILRFADLHRHSGFSFLDGGNHIHDLVERTEHAGALTDHGNMHGAIRYYNAMKQVGKQPILGFEAYAETMGGEKKGNHLLLLARNKEGFHNLMKLTSLAYDNFYRRPHISYEMLEEYAGGIISSTTCMGSEVSQLLLQGEYEKAKDVVKQLVKFFGKEYFYVEIQRHGFREEMIVNPQLISIAKELDLRIIATTDAHYKNVEDDYDHEILLCIGTKKVMQDEDRMKLPGSGYHLHRPEEMEELFKDLPEALDGTLDVAEKTSELKLSFGEVYMPHFDVPPPFKSEAEYFKHLCWEGFEKRFKGTEKYDSKEYRERLEFEIETILNMGFPGYFLIVHDFVDYAKNRGILVGPGRGSVVGALTAYVLGISELDPIPFGLLFERFLNPDRVSMPDIDLDFEDARRDEVIAYVENKYGHDAVSKIATFGTMAAKSAIKDVARALGHDPSFGARITKVIPDLPKRSIEEALAEIPEFKEMYDNEPDVKDVVDAARKFEGLPRHVSLHACGVIISKKPVHNYAATMRIRDKQTKEYEYATQVDKDESEMMGLLKMDFLGLRTMTVISKALKEINKSRPNDPLHYLDIPLNDKKVYAEIAKGETYGVFQLESAGMRSLMQDLFEDAMETEDGSMELFERLIAGVSLFRPGPLDYIPDYLKNMRNPDYIVYDHPKLEPILKETYGVIVYQEQTMHIVRELAGFTKGEADNVRKAFAKKQQDQIKPLSEKFLKGCVDNGIDEEVAQRIWDKMESFGSYAFNKSHAAAYSVLSNATAWLKYYYPVEFMSAVLNSYMGKPDKIKLMISIIRKMGIEILPPDVNKSGFEFTVDNGAIRFGLRGLKGMSKASENIIKEREENGPYKGLQDLAERIGLKYGISRNVLEALVFSGACDSFDKNRNAKLRMIDDVLDYVSEIKKAERTVNENQISLFDLTEFEGIKETSKKKIIPVDVPEIDKRLMLERENEIAGFYMSAHPLDEYEPHFIREKVYDIGYILDEGEVEEGDEDEELGISEVSGTAFDGEIVKVAGIIQEVKTFYSKRDNKPLKVFQLEDKTSEIKVVVFNNRLAQNQDKIYEGSIVVVEGQVQTDDFGAQIIANTLLDVRAMERHEVPKALWVRSNVKEDVEFLFDYVKGNEGGTPVYVLYQGKKYKSKKSFDLNLRTFSTLEDKFGDNAKIVY